MNRWLTALALALGLLLAPFAASAESGEGVVLGKDLVSRTLTVDGGITLHVTGDTTIEDGNGTAVSFETIPVTRRMQGGLMESDGDELIRWSARRSGQQMVAEQIQLIGVSIQ